MSSTFLSQYIILQKKLIYKYAQTAYSTNLYFEVQVLLIHLFICARDGNPNFIFREGIGKQKKRKITKKLTKLNTPKRKKPKQKQTSLV